MAWRNAVTAGFVAVCLALGGAVWAVPAGAQDISVNNAKQLGGHIAAAYMTTTQLERQMADLGSAPFSSSVMTGLAVADEALAKAELLANKHDYLDPGIRHVRDLLAKVRSAGKITKDTETLMDESSLELFSLGVNASILEAVAHLNAASAALDKDNRGEARFHLQQAGQPLEDANAKGAYHIQNDLEEIESALLSMGGMLEANVPGVREGIDERRAELTSHLFEVGMEHK